MKKIVFINSSPYKDGNTERIGLELLKNIEHKTIQMSEYKISQQGAVYEDDQIKELLNELKDADILVIGSPVYWYTVGGILKTFIDRLYLLAEAEILKGKELYFFAQGSRPDEGTVKTITHLAERVATLMEMNLRSVVVDSNDGNKILREMSIENNQDKK